MNERQPTLEEINTLQACVTIGDVIVTSEPENIVFLDCEACELLRDCEDDAYDVLDDSGKDIEYIHIPFSELIGAWVAQNLNK